MTSTQDEFRRKLMERDPHCVWTGFPEDACSGMHIIPHRRGSEVRSPVLLLVRDLIVSFLW